MAIPTFIPFRPPSPGTGDAPTVKILKADFGDGYSQYARDGLNNVRRHLTLKWENMTPGQATVMMLFFNGLGGCDPFWYTPSDEVTPVKWTCEKFDDTRGDGGLRTVSATFDQSFLLVT